MKSAVLYSFVRFRPYVETGEFVNVGLLMCDPDAQKLYYRVVEKDHTRVNHFFHGDGLFPKVRDRLNDELDYIAHQPLPTTKAEMVRFFHQYVDKKEGIFIYSQPIASLVANPSQAFDALYQQYIQ